MPRMREAGLLVAVPFLLLCAIQALAASTHPHARVIATIETGRRPEPAVADPSRHRVYIGNESGASVTVLDDRTERVLAVIPVGHEVEDLALDPGAGRLYTANRNSKSVSVVNTASLRVEATLNAHGAPIDLAVDGRRHRLYVANGAQDTLVVYDTRTLRRIEMTSGVLRGQPQAVGVDVGNGQVFLAGGRNLFLWNGARNLGLGARLVHPIRIDPRHHRLYIVSSGSSTLFIVDTRTLRVAGAVRTGGHPEGLDIAPEAHLAFVSNEGDPGTDRNSGTIVSIVDLRRGRVVDTVRVGLGPDGVAYDAATNRLYVCDENHATISVIQLPAGGY